MNFHELRIIVGQIKRGIDCARCQRIYKDEDITLIGIMSDEQTLFAVYCPKCQYESFVNVGIHIDETPCTLPKFTKLGSAPRKGQITTNDVLDISNFLKDFEGDFYSLFNQKK